MTTSIQELLSKLFQTHQITVTDDDKGFHIKKGNLAITANNVRELATEAGLAISNLDLKEMLASVSVTNEEKQKVAEEKQKLTEAKQKLAEEKQKGQNMSRQELVLAALDQMDAVFRDGAYYAADGFTWTFESVVFQTREWISRHFPYVVISKGDVLDALSECQVLLRKRDYTTLKNTLVYDPMVNSPLEEIVELICGKNHDPMYLTVIKAKLWSIKRGLFGLPKWNTFLLNFYGRENQGKDVFVKALFRNVFGQNVIGEVTDIGQVVNDSRYGRMFCDYNIVIVPELGGGDAANVSQFKSFLDREYVDIRVMGTTRFEKAKINADLISTSNENIRDVFLADHSVRKWAEVEFMYRPQTEDVMNQLVIPFLGDPTNGIAPRYNMVDVWKGINEQTPSPLRDCYSEFQEWTTKRCLYISKGNQFIIDEWRGLHSNGVTEIFGEDMYTKYKSCVGDVGKKMGLIKFYERMVLFGFEDTAPITSKQKRSFQVPTKLRFV